MEKVDIFDQEIGRAAIECNGNLVVVFNGKKAFWFKEQIESFVKEHPEAPLPLSVFCVTVSKPVTKPNPAASFVSFWEGFDFSNKAMTNNPGVTEAKFKDFCGDLIFSSKTERKQQIDTLLSRSKQGSKEMFLGFMELAEKHLADPNSPLRNEECYIPFLEYAIKEGKIDEAYKERYSFQLRNALKNRVGTIANDFTYITREGTTGTLKSIKANYTLIYFNNPDCHDCKRVYNILAGDSPTLAHLVARGELAILALYPDESLTSWNKNKGIYPYNWIVARYARDIDRERYNIPAIPSTYLLDKNKKVIYKDAIIEAVESYLRHKYKL